MRELTHEEVIGISGGNDFAGTVVMGSTMGAVGYGGLTMAAGYSTAVIASSFTMGGAVGGTLAGVAYLGYAGATELGAGTLGSAIGSGLATLSGAGAD